MYGSPRASGGQRMPSHLFGGSDSPHGTPSRVAQSPLRRVPSGDYSTYGSTRGAYQPTTPGRPSSMFNMSPISSPKPTRRSSLGDSGTFEGIPQQLYSIYDHILDMGDEPSKEPTRGGMGGPSLSQASPWNDHAFSPVRRRDPFFEGDNEEEFGTEYDISDHWVTIFGFPPRQTDFILKHFQRYGEIVRHEVEIGQPCNWVHVQYQTRMQAQKALSKNAKIIANGTLMIGVVQCIKSTTGRRKQAQTTQPKRYSTAYDVGVFASKKIPSTQNRSVWTKFTDYVLGL